MTPQWSVTAPFKRFRTLEEERTEKPRERAYRFLSASVGSQWDSRSWLQGSEEDALDEVGCFRKGSQEEKLSRILKLVVSTGDRGR